MSTTRITVVVEGGVVRDVLDAESGISLDTYEVFDLDSFESDDPDEQRDLIVAIRSQAATWWALENKQWLLDVAEKAERGLDSMEPDPDAALKREDREVPGGDATVETPGIKPTCHLNRWLREDGTCEHPDHDEAKDRNRKETNTILLALRYLQANWGDVEEWGRDVDYDLDSILPDPEEEIDKLCEQINTEGWETA